MGADGALDIGSPGPSPAAIIGGAWVRFPEPLSRLPLKLVMIVVPLEYRAVPLSDTLLPNKEVTRKVKPMTLGGFEMQILHEISKGP